MTVWLSRALLAAFFLLAATGLFFFAVTRGALLVRRAMGGPADSAAHVYPLYSNIRLIRLVDFQPIISAILLFQYNRLVSMITDGLRAMALRDQQVLITSCAFGNVIPHVVSAAFGAGARRVLIADIVKNELDHARGKLRGLAGAVDVRQDDAAALQLPDGAVAVNVVFFLLHELPHHLKGEVLREAARVLAPGGRLYLAEFHRPDPWVLRALGWMYFKVFEPFSLALWDTHDPVRQLEALGGFTCERRTVFHGYFQIIAATKHPSP